MWKTFISEDNVYMFKITEILDDYEFYLTNLTKIWSCKLSKDLITQKFQECNPVIETKSEEALTQSLQLLNKIDTLGEIKVFFSDSTAKLSLKSILSVLNESNFKIKYELELAKLENDLFMTTLTIPLIQTIILLEKQQNMMKNLLLKKDKELEEYQMEKGEISRSDLITEKFEPEMLISSSSTLLLNIFDKVEMQISQKYGKIEEKVAKVEVESWNNVKKRRKIYNKETAAKAQNIKIIYQGENKSA